MIDLRFVERLIRALDRSGLDSLELERGGTRIRLAKTPGSGIQVGSVPVVGGEVPQPASLTSAPAPAAPFGSSPPALPVAPEKVEGEAAVAPAEELLEIRSPMVGTFYRAPAPDAPPYVETGVRVRKGDVLCIIEAMKLMNELESEVGGTIAGILVESAQPVEYGQLLFLVRPA